MAKNAEKLAAQGQRLRDLRTFARLSQEAVARGIDCSTRAYQRWENGEGDPEPENLKKLAEFFSTTEDFIEYGTLKRETPDVIGSMADDNLAGLLQTTAERLDQLTQAVAELRDEIRLQANEQEERAEGVVERIAQAQRSIEDLLQPPRAQQA